MEGADALVLPGAAGSRHSPTKARIKFANRWESGSAREPVPTASGDSTGKVGFQRQTAVVLVEGESMGITGLLRRTAGRRCVWDDKYFWARWQISGVLGMTCGNS